MAKKPGPKPKPIDWNQFEQLCGLQCTQSEIASMLHISVDTVQKRVKENYLCEYTEAYKRYQEAGKCSLRRNQFVISKRNASMAIWLGKIWLGQRDPANEEAKEDMLHVLKAAVREIQSEPRIDPSSRSAMENKQSLLDKKYRGDSSEIQPKLGTENTMGETA